MLALLPNQNKTSHWVLFKEARLAGISLWEQKQNDSIDIICLLCFIQCDFSSSSNSWKLVTNHFDSSCTLLRTLFPPKPMKASYEENRHGKCPIRPDRDGIKQELFWLFLRKKYVRCLWPGTTLYFDQRHSDTSWPTALSVGEPPTPTPTNALPTNEPCDFVFHSIITWDWGSTYSYCVRFQICRAVTNVN